MEEKKVCSHCGQKIIRNVSGKPEHILEIVSLNEEVPVYRLKSNTRIKSVVEARWLYFYVAKMYNPNFSLNQIGQPIYKHHASVLYGIQQINDRMVTDHMIKRKVEKYRGIILKLIEDSQQNPLPAQADQTIGSQGS